MLVVSDRNVIDTQLQEALESFQRRKGVVASITSDDGSKSAKLADDAADFADLAKQLRKQQQGFFGGLF